MVGEEKRGRFRGCCEGHLRKREGTEASPLRKGCYEKPLIRLVAAKEALDCVCEEDRISLMCGEVTLLAFVISIGPRKDWEH